MLGLSFLVAGCHATLLPNSMVQVCGLQYRIEAQKPQSKEQGIEVYSAMDVKTRLPVRLTLGLPQDLLNRNFKISQLLETVPSVDSTYFVKVHCAQKNGIRDPKTGKILSAQVETYCGSLKEAMGYDLYDRETVETSLLPQLKDGLKEMRKLNLVHGNLKLENIHWCPRPGLENNYKNALQISSFYYARRTEFATNDRDLNSVGGLILQMLGLPEHDRSWADHLKNDPALVDLIYRLQGRIHPTQRLSFSAFDDRVEALRKQAEEEREVFRAQEQRNRQRTNEFAPAQLRPGRNKHLREPRDSFERAIDNDGMQLVDSFSDDEDQRKPRARHTFSNDEEEDHSFHATINNFAMDMDTSATMSDDWEPLAFN